MSFDTGIGDQACFCASCGWARRYIPGAAAAPTECPACGGAVVSACPACAAAIASTMAVACESCGAPLREPVTDGGLVIRRPRRLR